MTEGAAEIAPRREDRAGNPPGKIKQCHFLYSAEPQNVLLPRILPENEGKTPILQKSAKINILCRYFIL